MLGYIHHKNASIHIVLLVVRFIAGAFMITHGWGKLLKLVEGNFEFGDPLGLGPEISLVLVVFAEILCALLILLGLLTRWATIPLIITMLTAVFVVHATHGFGKQEMGLMYLGYYFTLLLLGPGAYSLDAMMQKGKRKMY